MRVGAPQKGHVEHSWQLDVLRKASGARNKWPVFDSAYRRADKPSRGVLRGHIVISPSSALAMFESSLLHPPARANTLGVIVGRCWMFVKLSWTFAIHCITLQYKRDILWNAN